MYQRYLYLDFLRIIAVSLVLYGHFISVGSYAKEIPGVVKDKLSSPLLEFENTNIFDLELFLISNFNTQTAVLGVTIFFVITGYLMPLMLDRYTRLAFLNNRMFRIVPSLIFCIFLIGIFLYLTQGIVFNSENYVYSILLVYPFTKTIPITGVLWTLVVEMMFYIICALTGKFTVYKFVALNVVFSFLILISLNMNHEFFLWNLVYYIKYVLLILIGTGIYLAERKDKLIEKISIYIFSFLMPFLFIDLFDKTFSINSNYSSFGNILLAMIMFLMGKYFFTYVYRPNNSKLIKKLSDIVYPVYLLHVALGLGSIYFLKLYGMQNSYLLVCMGLSISVIVAFLVHIIIEKPGIKLGRKLFSNFKLRLINRSGYIMIILPKFPHQPTSVIDSNSQ